MQQTVIEQGVPTDLQVADEWHRFNAWAAESRSISPFGDLALHWHAGHLTIAEGKRIEAAELLAHFLEAKSK